MSRNWCLAMLAVVSVVASGAATAQQEASEYNAAGVAYYNQGRWDNAIQSFERAYNLARDNEVVRHNLCNAYQARANALAKVADYAAAAKDLENAISVDPENPLPLLQLGSYYLRLDMVSDAVYRLEEAVELAPENLDGHELLGDAYYRENDLASALAHWEWVLETAPDRPNLAPKIEKATRERTVEQDFRQSDSRHFALSFPSGTPRRSLNTILAILERAYFEIGRRFDRTFPPGPIQVIVYNNQGFADATRQGEHVGALYDGKIRIPLFDTAGAALDENELKRRLFHEYTHVVVRFLASSNVPWWLNEGLAETFSRDYGPEQTMVLVPAQEQGALFPLKDLEGSQLERLDVNALRLAYCQSHATVQYLYSRFGQTRLRSMMSSLAEGATIEDALRTHYRLTYDGIEDAVARELARQAR